MRRASKLTVHELLASKGRRRWVQLHVDTPAEAAAAEAAGIHVISCEPDHSLEAIRRAAPLAMMSAGMPHGAVSSPEEAVRYGFAVLKRGADAVYTSHSPYFIEAMAREGIPVTGHVGLVHNLAHWTSFRAIGRTAEEALKVFRAAKDIERAGAAFLEVVPVQLARHISQSTPMITMGMGCGAACDTQYLFSCDVLGTNTGHYPRHSKKYADFAALQAQLQDKRIDAFRAFVDEVNAETYPALRHQIAMEDEAFENFVAHARAVRPGERNP